MKRRRILMQINLNSATRKRTVSIVPLIDIVFILLLFFMLSTSLIRGREIQVDFPSIVTESSETVIRTLRLETEGGVVSVGGRLIDTSDVDALVRLVNEEDDEVAYAVDTAPGISTQALVTLLDRLKAVDVENVSIVEAK